MRLIDADVLRYKAKNEVLFIGRHNGKTQAQLEFIVDTLIDHTPTIDAVPVVHGHWVERFDGRYGQRRTYCSVCNKHSGIGGNKQEPPFCPNCGARMDGE